MFGLQYRSSDNDWEGEVTLSRQHLVNFSALQRVELETSKECNKPTCSCHLFESQYQSLKDCHSLPGITTVCTTVTNRSPIQSHTSLAGRQYTSSATTSTSQTVYQTQKIAYFLFQSVILADQSLPQQKS